MWVGKPTDVWLHRLNKDGAESGMRDARRYYKTKQDAIAHHNHMVDANPGKEIAHNLHMSNELGHFKMKLIGRTTGRANKDKQRQFTMDQLIALTDEKGSAASAWMKDDKWEELLKLYNAGADIKVASHSLPKGADPDKWFKAKIAMMEPKGYRLFDKEENFDSLDMIFVRT